MSTARRVGQAMPLIRVAGPARCAAVLAAFSLLTATAAAAGDDSPLQPQPLSKETFAETYTAVATLVDGTYLQVQLVISNVGVGDGRGGCRLLVVPPGGEPWTASRVVKRSGWKYTGDPAARLTVADCFLTDPRTGTVTFSTTADGGRVILELAGQVQATKPPEHHLTVNGAFYEFEILLPWAAVRAELELPGVPKRQVDGYAYVDHARSTVLPKKLADGWVRFRSLGEDGMLILLRQPPGGKAPTGWVWQASGGGPQAIDSATVRRASDDGHWEAEVHAGDLRLTILSGEQLFRYAPVEERGFLGRLASRWIGNPVTTTFRGTMTSAADGTQRRGIMEVNRTTD